MTTSASSLGVDTEVPMGLRPIRTRVPTKRGSIYIRTYLVWLASALIALLVGWYCWSTAHHLQSHQTTVRQQTASELPGAQVLQVSGQGARDDQLQATSNELDNAVRRRAQAALLGAFVADAATMGLHWLYNPSAIKRKVGNAQPEFFDPPSSPFYSCQSGALSPYGAEALATLKSIVKREGVNGPDMVKDIVAYFDTYTGYQNSATRTLVRNVKSGRGFPDAAADDDQAHSLVKVPLVVARYVGQKELKDKVLEATRAHQKAKAADLYALAAADVLERVILGASVNDAVEKALQSVPSETRPALSGAFRRKHQSQEDVVEAAGVFGRSCHLPGSFQTPIVASLYGDSYVEAVRANIFAAGDQASRAQLVGAIRAAAEGIQAIPDEWQAKVSQLDEINNIIDQLLGQRFAA